VVTTASPSLGRRNLIINGGQTVWQRSTSATLSSAGTYITADRWKYWAGGATFASARTAFTAGQTDVPNFEYYNSFTIGANSAAGDYATFNQHIENVVLADAQTFTLSFYAKASQSWDIGIEPIQNFGSGGSSRVLGSPQNITVSTSWTRHTVTFTTASIAGKTLGTGHNFELAFWISGGSNFDARTGGIGNNSGTFDITGVQLEVGSLATPFEHRSYGEELALCQRYYYRMAENNGRTYFGVGRAESSGVIAAMDKFPVTMRGKPTLSDSGNTGWFFNANNNVTTVNSVFNDSSSENGFCVGFGVSGATANVIYGCFFENAGSAYLGFDAEL
jgi:hypothetical protein